MAHYVGLPPRAKWRSFSSELERERTPKPCATLKTSRTEPAPSPYLQGDSRHRDLQRMAPDASSRWSPTDPHGLLPAPCMARFVGKAFSSARSSAATYARRLAVSSKSRGSMGARNRPVSVENGRGSCVRSQVRPRTKRLAGKNTPATTTAASVSRARSTTPLWTLLRGPRGPSTARSAGRPLRTPSTSVARAARPPLPAPPPGVARFGFRVELGHELHAVRVRPEFWRDIKAPHIRTALSVIRLADEIRGHNDVDVTIVIEKGTRAADCRAAR
jgi:hypothetical protein